MAKKLAYEMSHRMDNGKWEIVGKVYRDDKDGRMTTWIDPKAMRHVLKGKNSDVPFILFEKEPAQKAEPVAQAPARSPKPFTPKPKVESVAKPSDNWDDFTDDKIPF